MRKHQTFRRPTAAVGIAALLIALQGISPAFAQAPTTTASGPAPAAAMPPATAAAATGDATGLPPIPQPLPTPPGEPPSAGNVSWEEILAKYSDPDSKFMVLEGADGIRLHYKDQGKGPALLLVHSSVGDLKDWDAWVSVLAKDYRVVRLDLPAFGLTGPVPSGNYSIDRYLTLVDALMDELGIERFAIVGTSYGGLAAFRYAATRTGRITGLVIMNSAGVEYGKQEVDPKTGEKKFYAASVSDSVSWDATKAGFRKAFNDPAKISDTWVTRKVDFSNIVGRDKEAALAIDQYVRGTPERVLAHVRAPVLVFWGGASLALSQDTADRFYAAVKNAAYREKQVLPNGGHMMHVEFPGPTVDVVAGFLEARVRKGAPALQAASPPAK